MSRRSCLILLACALATADLLFLGWRWHRDTAPNAEITVFPWREPPELKARTINRVRTFLKSHVPMRSAAQ